VAGDESARSQAILGELDHHGRVQVSDLAARLGVSPVTVRKDLQALEERSALRRVRGGAVAAPPGDEGPFEARMRLHRREDAIAHAGHGRIDHGFLSGTGSSAAHGLKDFALEEAEAERYLAGPCRQVHAPLDSSTFGAFSLHASVALAGLTAVWTDDAPTGPGPA